MNEVKIGNITLDLSNYSGKDLYSDGIIEDYILNCVKNGNIEETLKNSSEWPILYHLSDIRENLLDGLSISKDDSVLEVGSGCGAITGVLAKKAKNVTCVELSKKRSEINAYRNEKYENINIKVGNFQEIEKHLGTYDVITLIGVWEYAALYINGIKPYAELIILLKKHLNKNGKIIIAIENKTGIKYWNGAVEDHTHKQYSGLNDYTQNEKVRTFSKIEIENILKNLDIYDYKFYYPFPDYKLPDVIYSDERLPKVGELRTFKKNYSGTQIYNYNDSIINDQICSDGMVPYFSNSFLIIIGNTDDKILFEKYNRERKAEYRCGIRIITEDGAKYVIKYPLSEESKQHIRQIYENTNYFVNKSGKIQYISGNLEGDTFVSDYVEGVSLDSILFQYRHEPKQMVEEIKKLIDECYLSEDEDNLDFIISEQFKKVFGTHFPENKKSLERTNIDGIFQNMILSDGKVMLFDCEWVFDFPIPYEYVIWRTIFITYKKFQAYLMSKISLREFVNQCGISERDNEIYEKMEQSFMEYIYGQNGSEVYTSNYVKPAIMQSTRIWE